MRNAYVHCWVSLCSTQPTTPDPCHPQGFFVLIRVDSRLAFLYTVILFDSHLCAFFDASDAASLDSSNPSPSRIVIKKLISLFYHDIIISWCN